MRLRVPSLALRVVRGTPVPNSEEPETEPVGTESGQTGLACRLAIVLTQWRR